MDEIEILKYALEKLESDRDFANRNIKDVMSRIEILSNQRGVEISQTNPIYLPALDQTVAAKKRGHTWTPAQRKAASQRAKAKWAEKAAQEAQRLKATKKATKTVPKKTPKKNIPTE